jgi:hypothetical protein
MPDLSADDKAASGDHVAPPQSAATSRGGHLASQRRNNTIPILALSLGVIATCLAAYAAFKPAATPARDAAPSSATGQQAASADDAKEAMCTAADTVRKGVTLNTNMRVPGGPGDAVGNLAVAANARLSLSAGGQYLLTQLDPAAPADLRTEIQKFAAVLLDIGANATAGLPITDPAQAARLQDADAASKRITELCG